MNNFDIKQKISIIELHNLKSQSKNYFFLILKKINGKKYKYISLLFLILEIIYIYKTPIKKITKICLCVIGKNENLYAREFVEHYKTIGYNNIFIYDNNDKNGEHFEEVIDDYIKNGFVKIINYRERNFNSTPQIDAYRDCYQRNYQLYDWLSFFDMDEFLEINNKYNKIQSFLNDKIFKYCQNIKINWVFYKNNNSTMKINL